MIDAEKMSAKGGGHWFLRIVMGITSDSKKYPKHDRGEERTPLCLVSDSSVLMLMHLGILRNNNGTPVIARSRLTSLARILVPSF